jgi:hypothetical protein
MAHDRTLEQAHRQLKAFGVPLYEIQPIPPKGSDTLKRERIRKMTAAQVEASLGWAKAMNSQGYDIYIRPLAPSETTAHPLLFVDDVDRATIDRMSTDGLPFAVLLESSAARFHGWVRVAGGPQDRAEMSAAGKVVARRYGADPGSADWRHYGRLAGTTNRKPSRATPAGPPWVMLRATSPDIAPAGAEILAAGRALIEEDRLTAARLLQEARRAMAVSVASGNTVSALTAFLAAWQAATPARADDKSARDYAAVLSLVRRGYSDSEIEMALRDGSPGLGVDRHTDVERYVGLTIDNAKSRIASSPAFSRK